VSLLALLIVTAIWEGIEDEAFYRFLGAVAVANLWLVLLQPVARRVGGTSTASPSERARPATHRLAFTLRGTPSDAAVEGARRALERGGAKVEKIDRLR
jgi:hypothetical protein